MRVLQLISPTGFYGAERWILALARHLGDSRVGCDLAVTSEDPARRFELLERFDTADGEAHRVELAHRFDLRAVGRLREIVAAREIDLVHSHGYKSDLLGWLAARASGLPCISTPHGYGHGTNAKLRLFVLAGARVLRRLDRVVPLSERLVEETLAFGVPAARVRRIDNGVDVVEIDASVAPRRSDPDAPARRIGYVGQLIARKRLHELLGAFDELWRRDRSRTLDIAGDGPERERLERLAASLPCASAVRFHGFVERRLELMRTLDLFVMTSESEGIPRVLMEAQAIGVPVVAYGIEGVDELVVDGETGLLVPLGERAALVERCERLLGDGALAAALASRGRARVRERFSAERMAREYAALYRELVGAPATMAAAR